MCSVSGSIGCVREGEERGLNVIVILVLETEGKSIVKNVAPA